MNMRQKAKAATRAKAIDAARKAFAVTDYHAVTIRDLAKLMGMSTGAIFANFKGKADLWRASMPVPVPADTPVTRAAEMMMSVLQGLAADMDGFAIVMVGNHHEKICDVLELATSPLDGEAWARHLAVKAGVDAPRTAAPQAASLAPSDDAADRA